MSSIEILEFIVIGAIICTQGYFAWQTFKKIQSLNVFLPNIKNIELIKIYVPETVLENDNSENILNQKEYFLNDKQPDYTKPAPDGNFYALSVTPINILEFKGKNFLAQKMLLQINTYLLRNSGATTDFNLIKDIVERNVSQQEDEINTSVSVPLYLGLLGTMVGIVLGLFNMADLGGVLTPGAEDLMGQSISILLGGVKIAMIASLIGLLFTVINSSISIPTFSISFKDAKVNIESNKNDFYTFVQTELLPKINISLSGTFESLQRNLSQFNNDFTSNLGKLNNVFLRNQESVELQYKTFEKLEHLDIANIAKYNVTTLKQLETSLQQFDKFNLNVASLNKVMHASENVIVKLNELLDRTENFEYLAENLDLRLTESQNLLTFLTTHISSLNDYRKDVSTTAVKVSTEISGVFAELKEHIQESSKDMKNFTIQEVDIFKQAMQESRTNLSNLQFLSSLDKELGSFSKSSNKSNTELLSEIIAMKKSMADVYYKLKDIEEQSILYKASSLIGVKKGNK